MRVRWQTKSRGQCDSKKRGVCERKREGERSGWGRKREKRGEKGSKSLTQHREKPREKQILNVSQRWLHINAMHIPTHRME